MFGAVEPLGPVTDFGVDITPLVPSVTVDASGRALAVWVSYRTVMTIASTVSALAALLLRFYWWSGVPSSLEIPKRSWRPRPPAAAGGGPGRVTPRARR